MMSILPVFDDVLEAADRIQSYVHRTPILTSRTLDTMVNAVLFLKAENFQRVGAFKARGACNAVFALSEDEARRGVATHSSGNHAQAIAFAAGLRGIPAIVVMPEDAPPVKVAAVKDYGAAARRFSEEVDDPPGRCEDQVNLARLAYRAGDYNIAYEHRWQALDLARGLNDANIQAFALLFLGHAALGMDDCDGAVAAYTESLALRRALHQEHLIAEPLAGLAHTWLFQGELAQAHACIEELLPNLAADTVKSHRTLHGARDPIQIYLTAYDVLQALHDPRADDLLKQGYAHLQAHAAHISDAPCAVNFWKT